MERREFLSAAAASVAALPVKNEAGAQSRRKPNFIIILCDDLGWGDIEPNGGRTIHTPNINHMAAEGNLLTDYYAAQNICTPSRAGLLTGRYAIRTGLAYGVILPTNDDRRLPLSEVTIAAALKPAGYISALFGKWHLGHTTGGLRDRKGGAAYDGGYRLPCIARQPGVVKAGLRTNSIAMGIDFLPTFCAMAGIPNPPDVELDGRNISDVLTRGAASPHDQLLLFNDEEVVAVRTQQWKYATRSHYHGSLATTEDKGYPQLFDVSKDISESYSLARLQPAALADMQAGMKAARAQFGLLKANQLPKVFRDPLQQQLKEQLS